MSGGGLHLTPKKLVEEKEMVGRGMLTVIKFLQMYVDGTRVRQDAQNHSLGMCITKAKSVFTYLHILEEARSRQLLYFGSHNN